MQATHTTARPQQGQGIAGSPQIIHSETTAEGVTFAGVVNRSTSMGGADVAGVIGLGSDVGVGAGINTGELVVREIDCVPGESACTVEAVDGVTVGVASRGSRGSMPVVSDVEYVDVQADGKEKGDALKEAGKSVDRESNKEGVL